MERTRLKKLRQRSAGIIIYHSVTKKILLVRTSRGGRWEWPKGKIDAGETVLAAARREVREEVGLKNVRILSGCKRFLRYRFRVGQKEIAKTVSLYVGFGSGRVRLSVEHRAYRWCSYHEARRRLSHQNQKTVLRFVQNCLQASGHLPGGKIIGKMES